VWYGRKELTVLGILLQPDRNSNTYKTNQRDVTSLPQTSDTVYTGYDHSDHVTTDLVLNRSSAVNPNMYIFVSGAFFSASRTRRSAIPRAM